MTTSQTEKLEATAQYEAFKQIPKAHRTQDMQNVIYEYEQGNGITNESEKTEVIPPLILNAQQKQLKNSKQQHCSTQVQLNLIQIWLSSSVLQIQS
ncbi:hypothetical protein Q5113_13825 [Acinetobacter pittii]|uniref:hypothetical protein n=1 Tax=Acinetobacter pittii TaxID=48296 RepID=UPI00271014AC|nr:hypothetical protein [Acinetobacter pittii]MDO7536627.1 hypothetical protein [Acinetobacter pittii]